MTDSRSIILAAIRDSLTRTRSTLEQQASEFQPPHPRGPFVASDLELVELFRTELEALRAYVHVCEGPADAVEQVLALLEQAGARSALSWAPEQLPLPGLVEALAAGGVELVSGQVLGADRDELYAELEPAAVGISGVDAAIAESGTMLLLSGPGRGRLASLLPPMHIALLPEQHIVRSLPEALDRLSREFGAGVFDDRSNLTMITGPSRTADIELSLTLGVHGPREIHAVVIRGL